LEFGLWILDFNVLCLFIVMWYYSRVMDVISLAQIVLSAVLIVLILLQQNDASVGAAFGGGDEGGINRTRRGPEKVIFIATIVVAILFAVSSVAALLY
jgi:protein translocase SecG subunit